MMPPSGRPHLACSPARCSCGDSSITAFSPDFGLRGGGRAVRRAALFIRPALRAHSGSPALDLGCDLDADGLARTDADGRTSTPRVWAAGNATNPRAQVITAAGEGSAVAIAINAELVEADVDAARRRIAAVQAS